jgi:hypothetical protein
MINKMLPLSIVRDHLLQKSFAVYRNDDNELKKLYFTYDIKLVDDVGTWYELRTSPSNDDALLLPSLDEYSPEILLPSIHLDCNYYCVISYLWSY